MNATFPGSLAPPKVHGLGTRPFFLGDGRALAEENRSWNEWTLGAGSPALGRADLLASGVTRGRAEQRPITLTVSGRPWLCPLTFAHH